MSFRWRVHRLRTGRLTIERGRIAWVGPSKDRQCDLDLGNVAIIPGFVNAHTHLELDPTREHASNGLR